MGRDGGGHAGARTEAALLARAGAAPECASPSTRGSSSGSRTGVGRYLSELLVEWHDAGVRRRHERHALHPRGAPRRSPAGWATPCASCPARRHALGAVGLRAGARRQPPRRALRPGLYRAADLPRAGCPGRARRVVLRAPGVVLPPRRPAPPPAHRVGGAARGRRARAVGVLGGRDRAGTSASRTRASAMVYLGVRDPARPCRPRRRVTRRRLTPRPMALCQVRVRPASPRRSRRATRSCSSSARSSSGGGSTCSSTRSPPLPRRARTRASRSSAKTAPGRTSTSRPQVAARGPAGPRRACAHWVDDETLEALYT